MPDRRPSPPWQAGQEQAPEPSPPASGAEAEVERLLRELAETRSALAISDAERQDCEQRYDRARDDLARANEKLAHVADILRGTQDERDRMRPVVDQAVDLVSWYRRTSADADDPLRPLADAVDEAEQAVIDAARRWREMRRHEAATRPKPTAALLIAAVDALDAVPGEPRCTGLTARWCPVHGDCTCQPDEARPDTQLHSSPDCPLHGTTSNHAEGEPS